MTTPAVENARTLSAALGIPQDEAARLLDIQVLLTYENDDKASVLLAEYLTNLLSRTVTSVATSPNGEEAAELVLGSRVARTSHPVYVGATRGEITVVRGRQREAFPDLADVHPLFLMLAACYASGAALQEAFGNRSRIPAPPELRIPIAAVFGEDVSWLQKTVSIGETYLAGAGAVGNGFVAALATVNAEGVLYIADPDAIEDGNLNRCWWFTNPDLGLNKATRLSELAQPHFANLVLRPHDVMLQRVPGKTDSAWLKRLVVTVDSRRARRNLQNEFPGEVYDASTTGIDEIVLHFNKLPTQLACLSCTYGEAEQERAHEAHVAEMLGVDIAHVKQGFVSEEAAQLIHARYPNASVAALIGQAYDSLFKAMCGTGVLQRAEDRQVLAPFAFVSVMAGVYLAAEFCRRVVNNDVTGPFNYWRLSPWANPELRLRQTAGRNPRCEFCNNPVFLNVADILWRRM